MLPAITLTLTVALLNPAFDPLKRYEGRYTLVASESADIPEAIEKTVKQMNFITRGVARGRLQRTNRAFPSIEIRLNGDEFRITHEGGTSVAHRDFSTGIQTKAPDGKDIVVHLSPGPPLMQSYDSDDGRKENRYELSADGTRMTLNVRVTSPRLRQPLEYRLVFRRAN
jgi:hypothetical protein